MFLCNYSYNYKCPFFTWNQLGVNAVNPASLYTKLTNTLGVFRGLVEITGSKPLWSYRVHFRRCLQVFWWLYDSFTSIKPKPHA